MRRFTILLFLTIISAASLSAHPKFEAGKRYHIVCQQFTQGCVTDGNTAGKNTPLYYLTQATQDEETYWIFTGYFGDLYTIQNAKTGQYVVYDGVRQDTPQMRRYVSMIDEMDDEYYCLWSIEQQEDGIYTIRNVRETDQLWDVRVDSYCVGTYRNSSNGSLNQQFYFVDEEGNRTPEAAPNDTGHGFDVTLWLDATEQSADGWTFEGASWSDPNWGYYYNESASVVSPFLERWHSNSQGPLSDGSISQVISNLPAGNYTLCADIIAVRQSAGRGTPASGVTFYANDQQAACSTYNESPETYELELTVGEEGIIELGIRLEQTTANWVAFDNLLLLYHGTEEEMLEGEKNKIRKELADYLSPSEIEALIMQAGNNFYILEELRRSKSTMAGVDPLAQALKGLSIDGHAPVWVESLDLYLCSIPQEYLGNEMKARIDYELRDGYSQLQIERKAVAAGTDYQFSTLRPGRTYRFTVKDADGNTAVEKNITFTSLPVVKIYGSFNNDYQPGSIIVHEPDKDIPEMLGMKAKWRGGITNGNGKHKRNYHVKLLDAEGNKLEKKFFGLRNDNSWILESCQVDMSRIRNRVLTDLWNDYSALPYYIEHESKARTGTRGRFVELVLNEEYRGIYCMTENMDRKQMKLKKYDEEDGTIHGQLWKSKDWSYGVFMGHDSNSTSYPKRHPSDYHSWSDFWENYNVKYPDFEEMGYETDWETLYNAVDFVCTSSDADFKQHFTEYFDLPVVMDYYILMETILSTDNHGKNMYFACYDKQEDKKITLGVWDMDATCGQRWSDEYWHQPFLGPEQDYARFITNYEHGDYNLFRRLRNTNTEDFNMQVRMRYRDLRRNYLSTESILNRFRTQLAEFDASGASQREYDKWSYDSDVAGRQLDFDNEMEYIEDWFTRRMDYLDKTRFKIDDLPTEIEGVTTLPVTTQSDDIYNLRGQKVDGSSRSLPSGIYVVNGRKTFIK